MAVQVAHRDTNFKEQPYDLSNAQISAEDIDRASFDILHHQIRLAILSMTGIQKPGDIGLRDGRKYLALVEKTLPQLRVIGGDTQQLHRNLLRDFPIDALGQVYLAHAAAAKKRCQLVWSAASP